MTVRIVFLISDLLNIPKILFYLGDNVFLRKDNGYTERRFLEVVGSRCFDFVDLNC